MNMVCQGELLARLMEARGADTAASEAAVTSTPPRTFNMAEPAALLNPKEGSLHQRTCRPRTDSSGEHD